VADKDEDKIKEEIKKAGGKIKPGQEGLRNIKDKIRGKNQPRAGGKGGKGGKGRGK
jgi:hypothetical protein